MSTIISSKRPEAVLALEDGKVFRGYAIGYHGETSGEVVFNTSMSGYQEILTDPSYVFQILTFTYPHIGNVGVNDEDVESKQVHIAGMITREFSDHHSNFRANKSLNQYLIDNKVVGITGIDTRELVIHLRTHGSKMGIISAVEKNTDVLVDRARALPSMEGLDLVKKVTTAQAYDWNEGTWVPGKGYLQYSESEQKNKPLVVAIDCGIKFNILRLLADSGLRVRVVPAGTTSEEILKMSPAGVFLSNGPGDPAAVTNVIESVSGLVGKKPIFGICLGHQILGLSVGAPTFKLKFGHRGGNHPVRNEKTGKVEITVQNHGFATKIDAVPKGVTITHMNLNDQTVEGLEIADAAAFSVQYHPESSPGPTDAAYLFKQFRELVGSGRSLR